MDRSRMMWELLLRIAQSGTTGHLAMDAAERTLNAYEVWAKKEEVPPKEEVTYRLAFGSDDLGTVEIDAWPEPKVAEDGKITCPEIKVIRPLTGSAHRETVQRAYEAQKPILCALARQPVGAPMVYVELEEVYVTKLERLAGITERFTLKPLKVGQEELVPNQHPRLQCS